MPPLDVRAATLLIMWRRLVVLAISSGSLLFALADLSGLPLAAYDDGHLHVAAFFGMTLLAVSAYPRAPLTHLLFALGILAGVTELLQFTPGTGRQPDWADFGFNLLGIDCALILAALLRRLQPRATVAPVVAHHG